MANIPSKPDAWYAGIGRYQWLVLSIACMGWIFDVFEGQIFVVYKSPALADLLNVAETHTQVDWYGNLGSASYLTGGAFGGLLFGLLADRYGRRQSLVWSILAYSLFTGLHFFATSAWQVVVLRFLVATGVAGEWAIAVALVAEVFPPKARAAAGGIFHATSVLGAGLAAGVGMILVSQKDWRPAFLVGLLPAVLVLFVLRFVKESSRWRESQELQKKKNKQTSAWSILAELLGDRRWQGRALLGLGLASIGLGTYWGIYVWGPELVQEVLTDSMSEEKRRSAADFVYMLMNLTGGLAGLLLFAPIAMKTNRRTAFAFYHIGAIIVVPVTFLGCHAYWHTLILLPMMAFFVVGMHAGYAIYFPELFPTRLRATGASFCFNVGRFVAAFMLIFRGFLRDYLGLRWAVTTMAGLFLIGLILIWFAPETKDKDLPE